MDNTEFKRLVESANNILINTHLNPDEDAIGSALSVRSYISKAFPSKNVEVFIEGFINDKFSHLKNFEKITQIKNISDEVKNFDLIIFLDGCELSRFTNDSETLAKNIKDKKTICIDHHKGNPHQFDFLVLETNYPAATAIIFDLLFKENENLVDQETAQELLTGILGDTGGLRFINYSNTFVFEIVEKLLQISNGVIEDYVNQMSVLTETEIKVLAEFIKNIRFVKLETYPSFMYSFLSDEFIENFSEKDILSAKSNFSFQYLRLIKGYTWGFVVYPKADGDLSLSFRSASVNVGLISNQFNGGGHDKAAGGNFPRENKNELSAENACLKVVEYIKNNKLEVL